MEREWSGIASLAHLLAEDLYNMIAVASYDELATAWVFYYANKAFSAAYGAATDDVLESSFDSLGVLVAGDATSWGDVEESLRQREPLHVVVARPPRGGGVRFLDLTLSPVDTPVGGRVVLVGCPRDGFPELPKEVVIDTTGSSISDGAITKEDVIKPDDGSEMGLVCSVCYRLRTHSGEFVSIQSFFQDKLGIPVSQGLCEPCYDEVVRSNDLD